MKNNSLSSVKNAGFDGQFVDLTNNDMINLRGGTFPPYPSSGGEDYPIDLPKKVQSVNLIITLTQPIPVL